VNAVQTVVEPVSLVHLHVQARVVMADEHRPAFPGIPVGFPQPVQQLHEMRIWIDENRPAFRQWLCQKLAPIH
jgi:hypothetical protein